MFITSSLMFIIMYFFMFLCFNILCSVVFLLLLLMNICFGFVCVISVGCVSDS